MENGLWTFLSKRQQYKNPHSQSSYKERNNCGDSMLYSWKLDGFSVTYHTYKIQKPYMQPATLPPYRQGEVLRDQYFP